jgi:uncharacterized protein YgiB involved in biofilm formation
MAKRKKSCRKGVVKSGPRKGKCRKVCPKNCAKARTYGKRKAARKGKSRRRADCEKFGYSELLGRCRKGPARRGRPTAGSSSIFGPYASGYRVATTGPGPWSDAYVGAQSYPAAAAVQTRTPSAQEVKRMMARLQRQGTVF